MAKKIKVEVDLEDKQAKKKLEDLTNKKYKVDLNVDSNGVKNVNEQVQKLGNTASSTTTVFGKLKNAISNTFSFNKVSTTGYLAVLHEINQAGKNAKETIQELDKAITDLSVATNMSRDSVSSLLKTYNDYAKELKSTTVDVSSAADDYLRAGKSMSETQALIKDSIMLSKLGQLQSGEATEDLLATMNGYEMSVDEVGKALDAMVAVDLEASTSAGDIATALKYCASSADMAGVSFSKLTGMIAQTQDKTMQSAETIGVFYNTLLSRYRDIKIGNYLSEDGEDISDYESVLKSVGVNLRDAQGDFRNFEVVLDELAGKWSSLTSVQQAAVIKVAAGTRQQNRFIALMEGYDKVLELTETAANSAGTALDKFNTSYVNSLEAKQNTLQASFESMIMNSDFDEVYGGILEATTALVNFINETNALKGAMSGLTIGAGIKAFIAIKGGINEAYIELNKFQNALKIVKKTEISTESFERLKLLCDGLSKSQMKLVLSTNQLSVEQKKELLMASSLSEEEATLQLQTWNMAKANNGLTTSTTSASNAFKGLWATIKANKFMLITSAIMIGVYAINKYKETLENARSAAEDAKSTLSDMNKSVTDNGSWLAENTDRYKELSEGVNSLGQNVSLTDEEFKEYNTLTNEIAEMFPTLVTGYTDTGTAILSCKNNVDLLTKAYEEQKQAAQDAVIRNADDLVSGFNADTTNTNLFENNGMSKVDQLDLLNKMLNGNISNVPMDLSNTILKNAGVKVSWLESLTYDKGELDKKIQENKEQLYAYKRTLESEMEAATSDITPLIDYFLDTNKNFNELDESTKAGIKQVADNMGYEFYNSLASGEELTKTDLANWVDNTLLPSISNNGNANKAFSKLFTLNADDMPVSEYVTTVNDLVSKICMAVGGDPDKIKINLGFDVQADEDLLDKVYKVAGVDGSKFHTPGSDEANQQEELKSWIDSLNKDDLKLIAKGEIKFDENTTVQSAKEALKAAQNCADENPIEAKDHKGRPLKVGESQRKDLSYQYRYTDLLGKRHSIYSWRLLASDRTPAGKKDGKSLREKESEIQLMLSQGMTGLGMEFTLNDMFEYYIANKKYKGRNLSPNTISNYKMMYDNNVKDTVFGNMKISDIKKANVTNFYEQLQENGKSYGTISFFHKLLSSVFNMALDNNMISTNPTKRALDVVQGEHKKKEALTKKQQDEFLSYLYKNDRDMYRKVAFLIGTMCRVSEFAGLTWNDIDMKNKIITVDHQLQYKKFDGDKLKYHITPTKNTHTRKIPMTDDVYNVLCELRKYHFILKKDYCVDGKEDFVFFNKSGSLINITSFNNELKQAVKKYNEKSKNKIGNISAHILRHTGCTRDAEDGMDIKVLQYIMGHSSTQITNDVYNHVNEERAMSEVVNIAERRRNRA